MSDRLITSPAQEPVSLQDIKLHLRIGHSAEDDYLESLIISARSQIESYLGRALITQTRGLYLNSFPRVGCGIEIPNPPLQSISTVQYYDSSGVLQTIDSENYFVADKSAPAFIIPVNSYSWPSTQVGRPQSVIVTYVAGYGDEPVSVPYPIKQAIKLIVGYFYENRENNSARAPRAAEYLVDDYRVVEI